MKYFLFLLFSVSMIKGMSNLDCLQKLDEQLQKNVENYIKQLDQDIELFKQESAYMPDAQDELVKAERYKKRIVIAFNGLLATKHPQACVHFLCDKITRRRFAGFYLELSSLSRQYALLERRWK